jgi:hypothetical protein
MSKHTATFRGKRVAVTLHTGQVLVDRFIDRPKNRRWIELKVAGRIPMNQVKSFSPLQGEFDPKRMRSR